MASVIARLRGRARLQDERPFMRRPVTWDPRTVAAVAEGCCPTCGSRLLPVEFETPNGLRRFGRCLAHAISYRAGRDIWGSEPAVESVSDEEAIIGGWAMRSLDAWETAGGEP
jgi:hypothetical protein